MDDTEDDTPEPYVTAVDRGLAAAFLDGPWEPHAMVRRVRRAFRPAPPRLQVLAEAVVREQPRAPRDAPRELARLIATLRTTPAGTSAGALSARGRTPPPRHVRPALPVAAMGPTRFPVPLLATTPDLAAFLGLDDATLAWLADARSLERRAREERLRNYRYVAVPRPRGPVRVIEAPKPRLKAAQRTVLRDLLAWIPVHDAAHGFVAGRSAVSHAAAHTGRRVVVRFDLEDFFASVGPGRVFGVLRHAGYPEQVAHALTALATNAVPVVWWAALARPADRRAATAHHRLGRRLAHPHLPQGAPTSPALANLGAFALDRRLTALAASLGARYTRYADDLTFSGDAPLHRRLAALRAGVDAIVRDEGFRLNAAKTRVMTAAGRQEVCGVGVNAHPNVARAEVDRLKAILHALEHGRAAHPGRPGAADLRSHLRGRIDWVVSVNPSRGAILRARYDALDWA